MHYYKSLKIRFLSIYSFIFYEVFHKIPSDALKKHVKHWVLVSGIHFCFLGFREEFHEKSHKILKLDIEILYVFGNIVVTPSQDF